MSTTTHNSSPACNENGEHERDGHRLVIRGVSQSAVVSTTRRAYGGTQADELTSSQEDYLISLDDVSDSDNQVTIVEKVSNVILDDTVATEVPKRKLSGAARRRYKKLISGGMDKSKAVEECLKPIVQEPQKGPKNKRRRADNSSPKDLPAKKPKDGTENASARRPYRKPLTYSAVVNSVKIGVVPNDHPQRKFSNEEIDQIRKSVLMKIVELKGQSDVKPRFLQYPSAKAGWMTFHCSDAATADWLKKLNIWSSHNCTVVDEVSFPKECLVYGHFKYSSNESTETILGLIEGQNNLLASKWSEVYRKNEGSMAFLTFGVDETSMEQLQAQNFTVYFGYNQQVKLKQGGAKKALQIENEGTPMETEDNVSDSLGPISFIVPMNSEATSTPTSKDSPTTSTPKSQSIGTQPIYRNLDMNQAGTSSNGGVESVANHNNNK